MRLELSIYTALLIVGLGASYWASNPEEKEDNSVQALFTVAAANIDEVTYEFDEQTVRIAKKGGGPRFWVSTTKPAKAKPKSDGKDTTADAPGEPVREEFVGGDSLDSLLAAFAPFEALRSIGKVSADRLAEFGLKDKPGHFTLKAKDSDKKFQFAVGGKSYGSRNVFIMNTETTEVFLTKQDPFDQLRNANSRLFERKILGVAADEIDGAVITAGDKSKALSHKMRDDEGQLLWGDEGPDGQAKAAYKNWMEKLDKLRVTAFANEQEIALVDSAPVLLTVDYQSAGKKVDSIVIKKVSAAPSDAAGEAEVFWIRSDFLSTWAKVSHSRLDAVEKDLPSILE